MTPHIVVLSGLGEGAPPEAPSPLPAGQKSTGLWTLGLVGVLFLGVVFVARSKSYFVKTKNGYADFGAIEDARDYRRRYGGRIYLRKGDGYEGVLVS